MKKTFKQKITDYLNSLSDELRLEIEHRKNKPYTPKLNKLGKFAIILCCVIYLVIGFFGGIKFSASDDFVTPRVSDLYTAPSDLTGYTVTVPSNWTVTSGYGVVSYVNSSFDILDGDLVKGTFNGIALGYVLNFDSGTLEASANNIMFGNSYGYGEGPYVPSNPITLSNFTGDFATDSTLIQWFEDNNAIFVNNNIPEDPTTVTVPAGMYFLQNTYNDLRGSINFSVPFLSRSSYFDSIEFVGIQNEQYVSIHYVDSQDNISTVFRGDDGWTYNEYSVIYVQSAVELSEVEYELFSDAFVSFADNPDLNTLFSAGQENGQSVGYTNGFTAGKAEGRTEGYNQGFTEGESRGYLDGFDAGYAEGQAQAMEQGFMSEFFGGIVEALDALKLFGQFSVLDIIEGVLGLMLALWILKLIAGG